MKYNFDECLEAFYKKKNREIITNICALIKIISYKEKKTLITLKVKLKLCCVVYYVAMLWRAMVNKNQMMCCEIHCYAIVKYSNAMIRLTDLYAILCCMLLKICLN